MRVVPPLLSVLALPALAQVAPPPLGPVPSDDGPPLEIGLDRGGYSVAGPEVGGTGLWVRVVQRPGASFDPCSGVVERIASGAWAPADTLSCRAAPPPAPPGEITVSQFHLAPGLLRGLVDDGGQGTFRVVYTATGPQGGPLPDTLRTSPPFALVDFASVHPTVVEDVRGHGGWRALAAGRRENHAYFWGHSYGFASAPAAANRALAECRRRATRDGDSDCWIEAVLGPAASGD